MAYCRQMPMGIQHRRAYKWLQKFLNVGYVRQSFYVCIVGLSRAKLSSIMRYLFMGVNEMRVKYYRYCVGYG